MLLPWLYTVLGAWNGGEWDFDGAGIEAGHFALLEIEGVDAGDGGFVAGIVGWFNTLTYNSGDPIVPDYAAADVLYRLKALVDAALIGMASQDGSFLHAGNYHNRTAAEAAIAGLVRNGTGITVEWTGVDRATVSIGAYEVEIVFSGSFVIPVLGNTLAEQLAWLRTHAQSGNWYLVAINASENITPVNGAYLIFCVNAKCH